MMSWRNLTWHSRSMREIGITLTVASAILSLFIIVPLSSRTASAPAAVGAAIEPTEPKAPDAFATVPIEAAAAVVYDLSTGKMLYAKNADAQLPLASLTKILAVYAALSVLPSDALITISPQAAQVEFPRAFTEGQTLPLSDLARLTLTASLNDGAAAIIEAAAESQGLPENEVLARAAESLDLSQTYAVNGSGLDVDAAISGGYGSARDLARLAGALVSRTPAITAATTDGIVRGTARDGTVFSLKNTDPMVGNIPHLLLSKTGYTDLAGGNLALVFDVGINHPIAVIVLGSSREARFTDGNALVAATLAHFAGVTSL